MAAKKGRKQPKVEWVDMSLSKAEGDTMRKVYDDGEKVYADIERILDSGYKLTLSADEYNDCMACYIIPKGDDHVNAGAILTARGSDVWKAIRGALFRHYHLFNGDKWTDHGKQVVDAD